LAYEQYSQVHDRSWCLALVPAVFFATFVGKWRVILPPGISRVLEHVATKFQRLSPYFRSQAFQWCHFRYCV